MAQLKTTMSLDSCPLSLYPDLPSNHPHLAVIPSHTACIRVSLICICRGRIVGDDGTLATSLAEAVITRSRVGDKSARVRVSEVSAVPSDYFPEEEGRAVTGTCRQSCSGCIRSVRDLTLSWSPNQVITLLRLAHFN